MFSKDLYFKKGKQKGTGLNITSLVESYLQTGQIPNYTNENYIDRINQIKLYENKLLKIREGQKRKKVTITQTGKVKKELEITSQKIPTSYKKNKYIVNNLHTNTENIKTTEVRINGELIKAILDTGSNINLISRNLVEERGFLNLKNHEVKITNIFGQQNTLSEYVEIILSISDINVTTQCYIIENSETPLLIGNPLIERVNKKKNEIGQLKNKFKSVFNNELWY